MAIISENLKECKFCKIGKKIDVEKDIEALKRPFEAGWQNKHYDYDTAITWRTNRNSVFTNYGVLTGINQLGVLDDDTPDKKLIKLFEANFPDTFQTREHKYIKLKGWDGSKIIFYDENGKHMGELQGRGQQVVGAGSLHPSGEIYELKKDLPIVEIDFDLFKAIFNDYIIKKKKPNPEEYENKTTWTGEDIKQIPISNIISIGTLNDVGGGCFQGCHPKHGSENGMNFRVDTNQNTWYCFRCNSGGGSPSLIAVMEGIIDCSNAGSGCLRGDIGQKVINVARDKYGLKAPEQATLEPMGWANSVSIVKLADKHNLTSCPICSSSFDFDDRLGWYKCQGCGIKGGLKKFAKMILQNNCKEAKAE